MMHRIRVQHSFQKKNDSMEIYDDVHSGTDL